MFGTSPPPLLPVHPRILTPLQPLLIVRQIVRPALSSAEPPNTTQDITTRHTGWTQWLEAEEMRLGSSVHAVTPGTLRSGMQMNIGSTSHGVQRKNETKSNTKKQ